MEVTPEARNELRALLGEQIPEGDTAADTLFSDELIDSWLRSNPDLERAAYDGWRAKAAEMANLVNVTDGAAVREFSDLHEHALNMVRLYSRASSGPTEGRSRVGRIVRR